ncbi:transposase [Neobacillus niacini]|uniref:transposase n=1 Tax=Neobacillus niacini TaxID=86668 RepID=UPI003B58B3E2
MGFQEWYNWAILSQLEPKVNVAQTFKKHEKGILRWFVSKMTYGLLERKSQPGSSRQAQSKTIG